jgi:hypothetical protein
MRLSVILLKTLSVAQKVGHSVEVNNSLYLYVKEKKVKLSLCLTNSALRREGVWRSGCTDPHFLDLSAMFIRMCYNICSFTRTRGWND